MNDNLKDLVRDSDTEIAILCSKVKELEQRLDKARELLYDIRTIAKSLLHDTSITMQQEPENRAIKIILTKLGNVNW